jgi:mediator of RNA polymerase II transcription subunit 13
METSDSICVYPESCSKEDKIAAAALTGQQAMLSNHAAQAHGVSVTHILTFPASAVIQTQSSSMGGANMKDLDPLGKSALGAMPMEDDIFGEFFNLEEDDELLVENMNDKGLNESGAAMDTEMGNVKEKFETLLNQEELAHLDQQPLAVGYYVSTAKCGPLPNWLRGDAPLDSNFHTFKVTSFLINSKKRTLLILN